MSSSEIDFLGKQKKQVGGCDSKPMWVWIKSRYPLLQPAFNWGFRKAEDRIGFSVVSLVVTFMKVNP